MTHEIRKEPVLANFKTSRDDRQDPNHLENIRKLPCCIPNCFERRGIEAHHLKQGTGERGGAMRSTDANAVPLCHNHHINGVETVASTKEQQWFAMHGIPFPTDVAKALWAAKDDLGSMRRIINRAKKTARYNFYE